MHGKRRPPFKLPPRRPPGQSIHERYQRRLARHVVEVLVGIFAVGLSVGMMLAWLLGWLFGSTWLLTAGVAVTGGALLGCVWVHRRMQAEERQDENDRLGIQGERVVGEVLDDLKSKGCHVFHDVPPEREPQRGESLANFDHVLVDASGLYVIETKTRSKAEGRNQIQISSDGRVTINGRVPDRCPLMQVRRLANALRQALERETGLKDIPVQPVVIFPGWYIQDRSYRRAGGDVWTVNESAFAKWLEREPPRLQPTEISLLANRMEQRVRA